jgi:hypothetical protein
LVLLLRRHVVVQYRGKDQGGRDEKGDVVLYTATDPVHGGMCPYSQAVIMALLEKKVPFREVKVCANQHQHDTLLAGSSR